MFKKSPTVIDQIQKPEFVLPPILKGEVISTNDPQQEGRLLVYFPILGGKFGKGLTNTVVDHFKWIPYAPMFAGVGGDDLLRGPATAGQDDTEAGTRSSGNVAYGWWAIPRKGAIVFCFIANGDPNDIHWFACKYPTKAPATLFGGKFSNLSGIDGPLTETNQPIEPVYSNQTAAFGDRSGNYEWISRMADYNPSHISQGDISADLHPLNRNTQSPTFDAVNQTISEPDGSNIGRAMKYTPGYAKSRSEPTLDTNTPHDVDRLRATEQNSESTMFGFSTPGGHYISFDDRPEQCRTKIRSATGHSILLDDTNDRIYVSTNKGNSWFEMDSNGHVYAYSAESMSFKADGHLNLTAGKSIRLWAEDGIHNYTNGEYRVHTVNMDITAQNFKQKSTNMDVQASNGKFKIDTFNLSSNNMIHGTNSYVLNASGSINIKGGSAVNFESGFKLSIKSSGMVAVDGSVVSLNGGSASSATTTNPQTPVDPEVAWWTNITPQHEPWARCFNGSKDQDELTNHTPEFSYDDPAINRDMNQIIEYDRGELWRR